MISGHTKIPRQNGLIPLELRSGSFFFRREILGFVAEPTAGINLKSQHDHSQPRASSDMTEVEVAGYRIERNTVPLEQVQALASKIDEGLDVQVKRDKWTQFKTTTEAIAVQSEFVKSSQQKVAEFFKPRTVPPTPSLINVCKYDATEGDLSKPKTGRKGNVVVAIALTRLDSTSGWFDLITGSHRLDPKIERASFVLEPGDAAIWRGDLSYFHTPGGGGKFVLLIYDIQE